MTGLKKPTKRSWPYSQANCAAAALERRSRLGSAIINFMHEDGPTVSDSPTRPGLVPMPVSPCCASWISARHFRNCWSFDEL